MPPRARRVGADHSASCRSFDSDLSLSFSASAISRRRIPLSIGEYEEVHAEEACLEYELLIEFLVAGFRQDCGCRFQTGLWLQVSDRIVKCFTTTDCGNITPATVLIDRFVCRQE